ncbi:MAG: hypothetical protein RMI50_01450 [Aquificaceae bacterium]|nr:hypothetical protein [Aquificaceae bacterium]
MISGYLSSQQDLVDLLNGCLFSKVGILDLFLGMDTVSLYIEKGLITGFRLGLEEASSAKNPKSVLLYHLSQFMENPEAFFTFVEGKKEEIIKLEEPVPVEELVLQLQLVHSELKSLMEKVITPMAVVRVLKNFEDLEFYHGKSIYHILTSSGENLKEEIRRLKSLFSEGYLDINQFYNDALKDEVHIDYIMEKVEASRLNLLTLLENFQLGKFSGLVEILGEDFEFHLYYKGGRLLAVYPCSYEIFDFFLNPGDTSIMNVLAMNENLIDLIMLRHSEDKIVDGLPMHFFDVGKALMGMAADQKTGMITVYSEGSKTYLFYRNGAFLGAVKEEENLLKPLKRPTYYRKGWVDLIFYRPMENIKFVVYNFLINMVHGIILKHATHLNQVALNQLSFSDLLKYEEGLVLYRRSPREEDEEEVFGFLHFLLDLCYNPLGQTRLERELEAGLEPYRDVLKMLRVEEYINLYRP